MRKWVRDRIRKKKTTPNDTEQTGHIGQSKKTFEGAAAPLQPAYYDAPATGPQDARMETETQPESVSAPPASPEAATGRAPHQKTPRAPKGVVVLTIGLPGSGKTTWFKRRGVTPLSSDMLRSLLFDDITEQRYQENICLLHFALAPARASYRKNAVELCRRDQPFSARTQAVDRNGPQLGYEVQAVFLDVPLEVCLERNRKRERVVSEEIMRNMAQRLKAPTFDEGFSKIVVVRVKSKDSAAEE